jgi:hypothetical protein
MVEIILLTISRTITDDICGIINVIVDDVGGIIGVGTEYEKEWK